MYSTFRRKPSRKISESIGSGIDEKVNLGRRTAYSLMGAGFHGKSGLKQYIKANMWMKCVVPRLVYGLEWRFLV